MNVAFCVLTTHPHNALENRMLQSYVLGERPSLFLYWCLFQDEGTAAERQNLRTVLLPRPNDLVSRKPQYQCVAKIIAWLRRAYERHGHCSFIGWLDSDTWLIPSRMETFLNSMNSSGFDRTTPLWIGLFMHWSRYNASLLDALGFMQDSTIAEEAFASRLTRDRGGIRRQYGDDQYRWAASTNAGARREESFAMAQGSFIAYTNSAVATLLSFISNSAAAHDFLGLGRNSYQGRHLPRMVRRDKCVLPTDVALGWLTTRAFYGRALGVVPLANFLEIFVWPTLARFHENHTLIVHLADSKSALSMANVSTILDNLDQRVQYGAAPLVRPQLGCTPSRWLHNAAMNWVSCRNTAAHPRGWRPPRLRTSTSKRRKRRKHIPLLRARGIPDAASSKHRGIANASTNVPKT